ncbi:MAG: ABC transporter permease, partial [Chloroflexi bacterium]|nr:ABC transporter permease [Chloroflexota bacterium]
MQRYIAGRLAAAIPTVIGVATAVFLLVRLLPGDPALLIAGLLASGEEVERIRRQLGLDQPVLVQYGIFMSRLAQLDLGVSARTAQPVMGEILARLPNTMQLALTSMLIASAVGIMAGVMTAAHHNSPIDYGVSALTLVGVSMPVYWLGLMLIIVFAINLRWFPAAGAEGPASLVLPSLTLAAFSVALIARMTRSGMLEVLGQDYVRTARAKGL